MSEKPDTIPVKKLLENIKEGNYGVPRFQRKFKWDPKMVCELIESLFRDYYAGLLLFWELDSKEETPRKWQPIWGENEPESPDLAILDGQQRISSLNYAINNPNKPFPERTSHYIFKVDLLKLINAKLLGENPELLEKVDFEINYDSIVAYDFFLSGHKSWEELWSKNENWINSGWVPLPLLSKTTEDGSSFIESEIFNTWCRKFIKTNSSKLITKINPFKIYKIFKEFLNYKFMVLVLGKEREIKDICNIFTRINQKGLRLSTFDLMNAFLYPHGIELRLNLWDNLDNEKLKSIKGKIDEYLLKVISLKKQNYCSTKYIYNLIPEEKVHNKVIIKDKNEFERLWNRSCKYSEESRRKIMDIGFKNFGAVKNNFIPYTTMLPVMASIFWIMDEKNKDLDSIEFNKKLQRWYWISVFSEEYSGTSDGVMSKDFRIWRKHILEGSELKFRERLNTAKDKVRFELKDANKGSALYNAVLCLIALNEAKDFYTGTIVGSLEFNMETINDHHIFPVSINDSKITNDDYFMKNKNSIFNRTLLYDRTNEKIKNNNPSDYIKKLEANLGPKKVKNILKEHFINEITLEFLKNDDFKGFIESREKIIKNHIYKRLDGYL